MTTSFYPQNYPKEYSTTLPEKRSGAKIDTFLIAVLICSYFYTLPLGRYTIFGISSDFRVYDFVFIVCGFIIGLRNLREIFDLNADHSRYPFWTIILIGLVLFSLVLTAALGDLDKMLASLIRMYRFFMYFITPVLILAVVKTPKSQRFLFNLLYVNILIQAGLAFAQGLGWLPNLWPDYWRYSYHYYDAPVGTLSPHHLQIAVVMMMGIMMSVTLFQISRSILKIIWIAAGAAIMLSVIIMSGTRTVWFAMPLMILAYIWLNRIRGAIIFVVVAVLVSLSLYVAWDIISSPLEQQLNIRLFEPIERSGLSEVFGDRIQIYSGDFWDRLSDKPWVLIIGTGFQNISYFLGATGAHNNYLQAWFELGLIGLFVYLFYLKSILSTLRTAADHSTSRFELLLAKDTWVAFVGILITMLAGETLWAQYSMFTLSGQILALVGIATASLNWTESKSSEVDEKVAPKL
jgi:O-antigen ligase